jgi:hypothetical protein
MSTTLTIEVPEELFRRLQSEAAQLGKTPEALAAEYLSTLVPAASGVGLRRWAGALASGVSDASVRHDEYLGQALYEEFGEGRSD